MSANAGRGAATSLCREAPHNFRSWILCERASRRPLSRFQARSVTRSAPDHAIAPDIALTVSLPRPFLHGVRVFRVPSPSRWVPCHARVLFLAGQNGAILPVRLSRDGESVSRRPPLLRRFVPLFVPPPRLPYGQRL